LIEPLLFFVEISEVLARYVPRPMVTKIVNGFFDISTTISDEAIFETARRVAIIYGSRAADSYYVAVALEYQSLLITADRTQYNIAKDVGTEVLLIA